MDFHTAAKVGFGGGFAIGTALMARAAVSDIKAGVDPSSPDAKLGGAIKTTMMGSVAVGAAAVGLMMAHHGEIRPFTELLGMAFLGSFVAVPVSGSIAQVIEGAKASRPAG